MVEKHYLHQHVYPFIQPFQQYISSTYHHHLHPTQSSTSSTSSVLAGSLTVITFSCLLPSPRKQRMATTSPGWRFAPSPMPTWFARLLLWPPLLTPWPLSSGLCLPFSWRLSTTLRLQTLTSSSRLRPLDASSPYLLLPPCRFWIPLQRG